MTRLAHISDIHFGAVDLQAAERLRDGVNDKDVDAVIVTGDLTQAGRRSEFAAAGRYLEGFKAERLVVPGNHDTPVYNLALRFAKPWSRFKHYIDDELCPTLARAKFFVMGLNSARRARPGLDWSHGRISPRQRDMAARALAEADAPFKIVALHHPVTLAPGRAGEAVVEGAPAALAAFARADCDLVMTGHAHIAQAKSIAAAGRKFISAAAGTATSTRLRGEAPSFSLIRLDRDEIQIETHRYGERGYEKERVSGFARQTDGWTPLAA